MSKECLFHLIVLSAVVLVCRSQCVKSRGPKVIHVSPRDNSSTPRLITSPGYPHKNYPNNANCRWLIKTDPGYIIHLHVVDMMLETLYARCKYDYITLFDGEKYDEKHHHSSHTLSTVCHVVHGRDYYSTGRYMSVVFKSDATHSEKGFALRFTADSIRSLLPGAEGSSTTPSSHGGPPVIAHSPAFIAGMTVGAILLIVIPTALSLVSRRYCKRQNRQEQRVCSTHVVGMANAAPAQVLHDNVWFASVGDVFSSTSIIQPPSYASLLQKETAGEGVGLRPVDAGSSSSSGDAAAGSDVAAESPPPPSDPPSYAEATATTKATVVSSSKK